MCLGAPLLAGWVGRLRPAPPARRRRWPGTPSATRSAALMPELRSAAGRCARCACSARPCSRRRPPRRSAAWRRRSSAAAPSPSSSSAGRSPRWSACRSRRWHRRDLRLALAFGAGRAARRRAPRSGCTRAMPDGVKPAALSLAAWREAFTHPVLMAIVAVTALQAPGSSRCSPTSRPTTGRRCGATPAQISLLFAWFGAFGLIGNVLLSRHIDRFGAARCGGAHAVPDRAVAAGLAAGHRLRGHGAGAGARGRWAASRPTRRSRRGWAWPRRPWRRR